MTQHYPRNTVWASSWCKTCNGFTPHRIDDARVGPCLSCLDRLGAQASDRAADIEPAPVPPDVQLGLFGECK